MTILSVAFTKIHGEKGKKPPGPVKVNTNVAILNVEKATIQVGPNGQPAARFEFEFKVAYTPNCGNISIQGNVIFLETEENINNLVDGWNKDKSVEQEVVVRIINRILNKSHVQALILSKELGLPAPVQLPKVTSAKSE